MCYNTCYNITILVSAKYRHTKNITKLTLVCAEKSTPWSFVAESSSRSGPAETQAMATIKTTPRKIAFIFPVLFPLEENMGVEMLMIF